MIPPAAYPLDASFVSAARAYFVDGLKQIEHCVRQLSDAQVWQRPRPGMNSVGNLLLHLSGNVRQWIIAGVGGAADVRDRRAEFAADSGPAVAELMDRLRATVREAHAVMASLNAERLLETRRIQGFDTQVLAAVFHVVEHFRGHAQEITHMTRAMVGDRYVFAHSPEAFNRNAGATA